MPNSSDIEVRAGATIDDETGEMRVKKDTTIVAAHFRLKVQFLGFAGSSEPSHETCTASQSNHHLAEGTVNCSNQIGILY